MKSIERSGGDNAGGGSVAAPAQRSGGCSILSMAQWLAA
jgi:hypothetical protein